MKLSNDNNSILSKFANFAGKALFGEGVSQKDLPTGLAGIDKMHSADQLKFSAPSGLGGGSSQSAIDSSKLWGSLVS